MKPLTPIDGSIVDTPATSPSAPPAGIPVDLLRPAAPTLRDALTYIRVQAEAAATRAAALAQEAQAMQEMAEANRAHARRLEDVLFLLGEAA
ncbi:hypothetical protein [Teichococcus aestuarii]|uniref:hypothetical protein n=1 Tax=Teichococcus aestuarii TaxID=568898 RepID=UPI00361747DB